MDGIFDNGGGTCMSRQLLVAAAPCTVRITVAAATTLVDPVKFRLAISVELNALS